MVASPRLNDNPVDAYHRCARFGAAVALSRVEAHAMAQATPVFQADGVTVYFQSHRAGWNAGLVAHLVEFIAATRESLDCAIYDIRHPDILAALARVAQSGKRLRIVFDGGKHGGGLEADPKPDGSEQALVAAGLGAYATAVFESGRHLMHDKFLVRDGAAVWAGSANFTAGGLELQDNNCLALTSPELAAQYTAVFEALLANPDRRTHNHRAAFAVGGAQITASFAPAAGEGIEQQLVAALNQARRVRVLAFLVSDPAILAALVRFRDDPTLDIRGVYDPNGMQDVLRYTHQDPSLFWFTKDPRFVAAPSHAFDPAREQDFQHNKVLILDESHVFTGSYNFSENAEANDENILAISSPAVAAAYSAYFDALYTAYSHSSTGVAAGAASHVSRAPRDQSQMEDRLMENASMGPRPHVLNHGIRHGAGPIVRPTLAQARTRFAGQNPAGQTKYLIVYSDGSAEGNASAQAVLKTADADYAAVTDWFGGISLPQGQPGDDQNTPRTALPVQVLMDANAGGAYHYGCDATDIYIQPVPELASGFMVAELVEIFEAAQGKGWQCGNTNGEGLSRVLAAERNANLGSDLAQTIQSWWSNGHNDYVNQNSATDQDEDSNGCATLFLYYLHSQLGYSWRQITTTGGADLGACYRGLTGKDPSQGFSDFVSTVSSLDQGGQLSLPASGNPFPIGAAGQPSTGGSQGSSQGSGDPSVPVTVGGRTNWALIITIVLIIIVILAIVGGELFAQGKFAL